ncbi:MAG TPA: LuxR family transcriptional regulator, partial [Gemmatimonadaceae bacterium]|nr:LuxR family transcriptional regulator [Gemmatimonadaceae bacterium]
LEALVARNPAHVVVGAAPGAGAHQLAEHVEQLEPDVVLVALEPHDAPDADTSPGGAFPALLPTPGGDGRASPAVVLLADLPEAEPAAWAAAALRAGVRAVLPREAGEAEIAAAVDAAAAGLVVLPGALVESLLPAAAPALPPRAPAPAGSPGQSLTPREAEVLGMLAEGLPNKLIAPRLGISEHTVKFHIASIFEKLGASSRTEAVTIGARRGLIML